MTTYHLDLSERADVPGERDRTIAALATEDKAVMAAVLRAAADQLDPPQPVRPAYRHGENIPASLGLNAYARGERPRWVDDGVRVDRCRDDACSEGHTYAEGCLLRVGAQGDTVVNAPLRDFRGLPNYAHEAHCNTIHDAGPNPCPPPLPRCPAVHDNGRKCVRTAHGDFGHKLAFAYRGEDLHWDAPDGIPAVVDGDGTAPGTALS